MARIARIADRDTFVALRRPRAVGGARTRSGPLSLTWIPPSARPTRSTTPMSGAAMPPAVAFAVGKPVGSAVVRNRLRRQLRAQLRAAELAPGAYLVGVAPEAASLDFAGLDQHLRSCIAALRVVESGPA